MNTVTIEVVETFQETVQSVRLLVLEIPADSPWDDPEWLRRVLHHGEEDCGPFPARPIEGTLERRLLGIRVIGETDLPPDIRLGVGG